MNLRLNAVGPELTASPNEITPLTLFMPHPLCVMLCSRQPIPPPEHIEVNIGALRHLDTSFF